MALPSSGPISFSAIKTELSITTGNNSLAGASTPTSTSLFGVANTSISKIAPHSLGEFWGYTHSTSGGGGAGGGGGPDKGGGL
tara:strand:+ start:351 stop:599 length:249 start_codon:yes stop_codon:yes gene_type:complete